MSGTCSTHGEHLKCVHSFSLKTFGFHRESRILFVKVSDVSFSKNILPHGVSK
jgi:hypothetical protein